MSRTNLRTGGLQRDKIVMHARGNSTAFPPLRKLPRSTLQPVAQPLQPATLQPVAQPLQHSTLQPCNLQPCSLAASSFAALQPAPIQPPDAEGVGCIIGRRPLNSLLCLGTVNRFWHTRQAVAVPGWQSAIGLPGRILVELLPGEHRHRPSGRRADFGVF